MLKNCPFGQLQKIIQLTMITEANKNQSPQNVCQQCFKASKHASLVSKRFKNSHHTTKRPKRSNKLTTIPTIDQADEEQSASASDSLNSGQNLSALASRSSNTNSISDG